MQVVLVYLEWFWRNSLLKCVSQPEIEKRITKNHYFCGSRSFKVIDVGTTGKLVCSACYDNSKSVSICNRFYATRANATEIMIFNGATPISCLRSRGISSPSGTKLPHKKLDTLGYHTLETRSLYLTWARIGTGS